MSFLDPSNKLKNKQFDDKLCFREPDQFTDEQLQKLLKLRHIRRYLLDAGLV